jgi:hypothetical protein
MTRARIVRGRATQGLAAAYWQQHGWPHAEPVWGSQPGRDVTGMPGLAPEIKATRDDPILGGLRQAQRNAGHDVPFVVWRPNGYGPERIGEWVMAFTLHHGTELLRGAGYGDGL